MATARRDAARDARRCRRARLDEPRIAHLAVDLEASGAVVPTAWPGGAAAAPTEGRSGDLRGRVRQKIWAEAGLSRRGTLFSSKMELTEGPHVIVTSRI